MFSARRLAPLILLALAACSRGLTPHETEVAQSLFGPSLDTAPIRVMTGIGVTPLPRPRPEPATTAAATSADAAPAAPRKAPAGICTRTQRASRVIDWPAAFVIDDKIYFNHRYYAADAFVGLPGSVLYPTALVMGHELVHVWQWQNRDLTGFSTRTAGAESLAQVDPYYFEPDRDAEFLTFGYEQQGAIVQDFLCYAWLAPTDPKLAELTALLRPVFPVDDFLRTWGRKPPR